MLTLASTAAGLTKFLPLRDNRALRLVLRCLLCCVARSSTTASKLASRAGGNH